MENQKKHQKRMAVINDFTGFGRCSLTISIPITSQLGIQCCPVPTSVFSNHTAFPSFYFDDYTERMPSYIREWEKMHLTFDGIQTGFLGSWQQIRTVLDFINTFSSPDTTVLVDPVMGDNGKPYALYDEKMQNAMRNLASKADILTPNLTEACILTFSSYHEGNWKKDELFPMIRKLADLGAKKTVISGVPMGKYLGNVILEQGSEPKLLRFAKAGKERCGTGDIFSSILAADAVNGVPFETSVRKAASFIRRCILVTEDFDTPLSEGVCFEEILHTLRR